MRRVRQALRYDEDQNVLLFLDTLDLPQHRLSRTPAAAAGGPSLSPSRSGCQ